MAAVIGSPRARLAGRDGGLESDWAPSRGLAPRSFAYLYLGLADASAFSPAGTMPMSRARRPQWGVQPLISIAVIGLVITQAVNVFA